MLCEARSRTVYHPPRFSCEPNVEGDGVGHGCECMGCFRPSRLGLLGPPLYGRRYSWSFCTSLWLKSRGTEVPLGTRSEAQDHSRVSIAMHRDTVHRRLGFVEIGRSRVDGQGRPYPLIHLRYAEEMERVKGIEPSS